MMPNPRRPDWGVMWSVIRLAAMAVLATPAVAQRAGDPEPRDAIQATLDAFDRHSVVALGMSHWQQTEADFSLALVREPRFASIVNDIVVECGNPRYQKWLDRYIAGDSVPLVALQAVWQNTTQPGRCDPRQHKELLDRVREINRKLAPARRLRVLAGDSPIDWNKIHRPEDLRPFESRRDTDFASIVEREVLAKHRRALLVIGAAHVLRHPVSWRNASPPPAPTVTMLLERHFPGSTYVITPHDGFGDRLPEFEGRFSSWPVPSLMPLHGSWLGSTPAGLLFSGNVRRVGADPRIQEDPYPDLLLQDLANAFLYLGPLAAITRVEFPEPIPGTAYARELARRHRLMGEAPMARAPAVP